MTKVTVINRKTGERKTWDAKNVKHCNPEALEKMRKDKNHALISFIIEFKGLDYDLGMWSVDDYDLVVE